MSGSLNRWIAITLLTLVSYGSVAVAADVKTSLAAGDAGKIYFNSAERDATYGQLYKHTAVFDDAIWGDLRFPSGVPADKVPVMVVMHGSAGVNKSVYAWVKFLNQMGVATFMIDSFTPRGINRTVEDQSQLSPSATSADGLLALKLLATHPRIDASRIGIMGFSKGGTGALTASFEKLRESVVRGDLKYALHIPFYGGCTQYAKTTSAPILMLAGTRDDYHKAEDCKKNADTLRSLGANLKSVVYAGAMHGFDTENPRVYVPRGQTWVKCSRAMDLDRMEMHINWAEQVASPQEARDYSRSCMTTGLTVGGDAGYREKSRKEVKDFITQNFGLAGQ
ncbi:MAG: dienelactone hydrolase family protein [Oxalobacteraceae bacterium]|nr:dienelactone hydrolase family protein [Oxalobacteraceae bacterium]